MRQASDFFSRCLEAPFIQSEGIRREEINDAYLSEFVRRLQGKRL